jgi:hypothetical protein
MFVVLSAKKLRHALNARFRISRARGAGQVI